jgi:hypothetical protein
MKYVTHKSSDGMIKWFYWNKKRVFRLIFQPKEIKTKEFETTHEPTGLSHRLVAPTNLLLSLFYFSEGLGT